MLAGLFPLGFPAFLTRRQLTFCHTLVRSAMA